MTSRILLSAFGLLLAAQSVPSAVGPKAPFREATVAQFEQLARQTNTVILDVRTAREYAAGHIAGATNIDWNAPNFQQKVAGLDRGKTYLVHCASGRRSLSACNKLSSLGFTNLYNLTPGFRAWQAEGKPVAR